MAQDVSQETTRECLELRGQLAAEKQRADALEWALVHLIDENGIGNVECKQCDKVSAIYDAAAARQPKEPEAL